MKNDMSQSTCNTQLQAISALKSKPFPVNISMSDESSLELKQILILVKGQTGYDFSHYKPNTILRRIQTRLECLQIDTLSTYLYYLYHHPAEITTLFKRLFIHVTHFFRDPEAFEVLKSELLTTLKDHPMDTCFKIWIPGCSTGEEAYSIAIVMQECMSILNRSLDVRIFATDVDEKAIETARCGIFLAGIEKNVSTERLRTYFIKEDGAYRASAGLRNTIVFAVQNIITDPPFTKLNLLCCRNLLIYLEPPLQNKLLSSFHYGLNPDGLLFLGPSENTRTSIDLFNVVDPKWRLYRREATTHQTQSRTGMSSTHPLANITGVKMIANITRDIEPKLSGLVKNLLANNYTPAFIVIDEKGDIIYVHGRTSKFLELSSGEVRLNLMNMIRPELKSMLHIGIRKASSQQTEICLNGVQITDHNIHHHINVKIKPINGMESTLRDLILIIIEDVPAPESLFITQNSHVAQEELNEKTALVIEELNYKINSLQTMIEELSSANEESLATNEELQSLNESLTKLNTELENRNEHLASAKAEIKCLLNHTEIATIFLDRDLCIKRFTPKATEIINLIPADVGRPLNHLVSNLQYQALAEDARMVLQTQMPFDTECEDKNGLSYLIKMTPYRSVNNLAAGVNITFLNIHSQKQAEKQLRLLECERCISLDVNPDRVLAECSL